MAEKEPITVDLNEEKILLEWRAPERSFQKRDKDFWITAIALLVLVSIILIFIKEFFLIITLVSILFLFYVLSTVPPALITNKITNRGIQFGDLRYRWDDLVKFNFKKSLSNETIQFETALRFPRQISLIINPLDKEKIKNIVVKRIPLVETSPSFIDKLTKWFSDRLPLEKRS